MHTYTLLLAMCAVAATIADRMTTEEYFNAPEEVRCSCSGALPCETYAQSYLMYTIHYATPGAKTWPHCMTQSLCMMYADTVFNCVMWRQDQLAARRVITTITTAPTPARVTSTANASTTTVSASTPAPVTTTTSSPSTTTSAPAPVTTITISPSTPTSAPAPVTTTTSSPSPATTTTTTTPAPSTAKVVPASTTVIDTIPGSVGGTPTDARVAETDPGTDPQAVAAQRTKASAGATWMWVGVAGGIVVLVVVAALFGWRMRGRAGVPTASLSFENASSSSLPGVGGTAPAHKDTFGPRGSYYEYGLPETEFRQYLQPQVLRHAETAMYTEPPNPPPAKEDPDVVLVNGCYGQSFVATNVDPVYDTITDVDEALAVALSPYEEPSGEGDPAEEIPLYTQPDREGGPEPRYDDAVVGEHLYDMANADVSGSIAVYATADVCTPQTTDV